MRNIEEEPRNMKKTEQKQSGVLPNLINSRPSIPHPTITHRQIEDEKVNTTNRRHVAIILPTYCEAENIADIIHAIENLKLNSTLLVINDSSPDETKNIVCNLKEKNKNILLLQRPHKMGLGTAITDGFRFLLALPKPPKSFFRTK